MALRGNRNSAGKLNRDREERASQKQAGFFDLQENMSADSSGDRPYRERHRVEVTSSPRSSDPYGSRVIHGNTPGNRTYTDSSRDASREISTDLFAPRGSGSNRTQRTNRTNRANASPAQDRQRGYTQGGYTRKGYSQEEYSWKSYSQGGYSQKGYSQEDHSRNSYSQGGYSQKGYSQRENTGNSYGRSNRGTDSYFTDFTQARTRTGRAESRRTGVDYVSTDLAPLQSRSRRDQRPSAWSRNDRMDTFTGQSRSARTDSYSRQSRSVRREYDPFDPYYPDEYIQKRPGFYSESYNEEADEFDPDYEPEDRQNRRGELRRNREKQLKQMYLKIGAAAAVLIVLLIIFSAAPAGLRKKSGTQEEMPDTAVQQAAETVVGEEQPAQAAGQEEDPGQAQAAGQEGDPGQAQAPAEESAQAQPGAEQEASSEVPAAEAGDGSVPAEDVPAAAEQTADTAGSEAADQQTAADPSAAQNAELAAGADAAAAAPDTQSSAYASQDDWRLILVNPWTRLPENYEVETKQLLNGEQVDSRCYSELVQMLDDCKAAGGTPIVCSSYRPYDKQVRLFKEEIDKLVAQGKSKEQAEIEAGTAVAIPGTSEHEIGLAVDICDSDYQNLDDRQADTVTQKWLMEHCCDYGFILRYPADKVEVTGIMYEPWHYRYVGRDNAQAMKAGNLCLEEYLQAQ